MPVKKSSELKVKSVELKAAKISSSRAERGDLSVKIAASQKASRNDEKTALSVPVYSLAGIAAGNLDLPKEFFGAEVNKSLLAQAMRVYLNNQKAHWSNTKTRGEVEGSTRKIYQQKGTGRARHGGIRAPIFVGGGKAMGAKYRKVILDLPKKMKKAALISALSQKAKDKEIMGLSNVDKASGKTKEFVSLFKKLNTKSILIVVDKSMENVQRSLNNIKNVKLLTAVQLNAYEVIKARNIFVTKEAILSLGKGEK